jgi:hypothetical protein
MPSGGALPCLTQPPPPAHRRPSRFQEGLEYIKGLPRDQAAAALQKYGKVWRGRSWGERGGALASCIASALLLQGFAVMSRHWHPAALPHSHFPLTPHRTLHIAPACAPPPPPSPPQALLGRVPVEATALLMELCLRDPSNPSAFVANMADFTHLYADRHVRVCRGGGGGGPRQVPLACPCGCCTYAQRRCSGAARAP